MTTHLRSTSVLVLALGLVLQSTAQAATASKDGSTKSAANFRVVPEVPIPLSVFAIPSQPSEGRNPFFPQSTIRVVPQKVTKETPLDASWFVLNGITSPPKRTAMINGRTFETGEEGEVRVPSGSKVLIKCIEIKAESAIIETGGQRRELRLRSGL
ncbi:MAG TPA: hypothetical protein VFE51_13895 [Verrucomicrobiae bacterium]|nr:hypothetical protein [Verrucomicrobiae bacterium]